MAKAKGSKGGRSKRTPSNAQQPLRTARNKRLKLERHENRMAAKANKRRRWERRQPRARTSSFPELVTS